MNKRFTLIELLVVVAIIGILASMLLPALSKSKAVGKQAVCLNNLKQIYLWTNLYGDSNADMLPKGDTGNLSWDDLLGTTDSRGLAPAICAPQGVNPYTISTPVRSSINLTYRCSLDMRRDGDWIARSYSMNAELAGSDWPARTNTSLDSLANPSSTILYGERIVSDILYLGWNGAILGNDELASFNNDVRAGSSGNNCGSSVSCSSWISNHPKSGYLPWAYADGHVDIAPRAVASFLPQ